MSCGTGGIRFRQIKCTHISGYATLQTNCKGIKRPLSERSCFKTCEEHRNKVEWDIGDWGTCLGDVEILCPELHGVQYRKVTCSFIESRESLEDVVCETFSPRPLSKRPCGLQCPQDCIVTEFGAWGVCQGCDIPQQVRTRSVLVPPMFSGRSCPSLAETRPCNEQLSGGKCLALAGRGIDHAGVYRYKVGQWGKCKRFSERRRRRLREIGSKLGHQKREVGCVNDRGDMVEKRSV